MVVVVASHCLFFLVFIVVVVVIRWSSTCSGSTDGASPEGLARGRELSIPLRFVDDVASIVAEW